MRREADWRKVLLQCVSLALLFVLISFSFADVLMPSTGKQTKKNGGLVIDYSHMDDGYVMVKSAKGKKKLKVRVVMGKETLTYDLNNDGDYEVFPLQYGNGKYTFTLYKNVSGKKYSEEGKVSLTAKMPDELSAFLYPNQYVDYNEKTAAVLEAEKLCKDMSTEKEKYKAICNYMKSHFAYDYIKSVSVKAGQLPQIDDAWKKHMGICQDLSAIMVAMLRTQGIPARLMIGTLNATTYHAWVTAVVDGKEEFFDPTAALNAVSNGSYTVERYY
ncbi:MAG: transglutaminase family protein [Clostridia bacterium]|nr:transglutaminase family protein [Clostridia bacterium]